MFKPDSWQSHNEYRTLVNLFGKRLSRNPQKYSFDAYGEECQKLLNLNLDPASDYISRFYSKTGRPAKNQARIIRSLILFVLLFNKTKAGTSLTKWVREVLPSSASLTILVGCSSADKLPPLGSYYDLMNRFWLGKRDAYSGRALLPANKNGRKPKKQIGTDGRLIEPRADTDNGSIANDIMNRHPASDNPEAATRKIFFLLATLPSIESGLIDTGNLTLSGDGTAVVSHSSPFGRHLSSRGPSRAFRKNRMRHYSDPDASRGWDSDNKTWYFGHAVYMLCRRNNSLQTDLPLLMKFTGAERHDSKNFLYAIDDFGRNGFGLSPKNVCLDSAHDNIPTYRLLERRNINALIDINGRAKSSENAPDDISFNKDGHPLRRAGHEMCPWGNDPIKDAHKYRCPLKRGKITSCPYAGKCSPGNYGRTVYVKHNADPRFHPRIPHDSEEYKNIYSERTARERLNNRFLNDYCLRHLKIRGRDHFSFRTMLIGICIHLDARAKAASLYHS